jgi:hypothetical protein
MQAVARDERVEPVADRLGIEAAREAHGTKHVRGERHLDPAELVLEEAVIEARVVRDEEVALEHLVHGAPHFGERGRLAHHRVGDAGEGLDLLGDAALGIDERAPFVDHFAVGHAHDADLGHAVRGRDGSGGLQVDECDGGGEHGVDCRARRGPFAIRDKIVDNPEKPCPAAVPNRPPASPATPSA